jgi:hypothetical protein
MTTTDPRPPTLVTKYGTMEIHPTRRGQIYLNANTNCMGDPSVGLTVRGVRYGVTLHVSLQEGAWRPSLDANGRPFGALFMLPADDDTDEDPVSEAATQAVLTEVLPAITAWVAAHPEVMEQARPADIANASRR